VKKIKIVVTFCRKAEKSIVDISYGTIYGSLKLKGKMRLVVVLPRSVGGSKRSCSGIGAGRAIKYQRKIQLWDKIA